MAGNHENHGLLLAGAILLLTLLLVVKLRRRSKQYGGVTLNLPPGPWQLPVIGSMHHLVGALPHRAMRNLALRHGPLMLLRMGELPVVVASSAAAAMEIMKTHDVAFATRPRTNTTVSLTGDGLGIALAPHGDHWRRVRKLCATELLGAPRVRSFRGTREAEAAALVASVAVEAASGAAVNVSSLVATYVADAVVRSMVGDRIADREAFLACLCEGVRVAAGFSLADLFPSSRLARALSGTARQVEATVREMSRLMDGVIEEKRARKAAGAGCEEEEDILDVLLDGGGGGAPLDIGTVRAMMRDLFGAGSETSASTLQWAMAELVRKPAALRRAQAEVRSALAGQSRAREEALQELPYLRLVIKETLRLHAAVPLLLPRECREPSRVLGYDVPQGTMVLVNAWAIGRDAASWGPDAEEFRPERFEEESAAAVDFRGTDFQLVPFGAGRRMCPGITFGLAVMEVALASLLFHFDWELPGGTEELDMAEAFGITARRKSDLWLHATVVVPPL
ncbi:desmethyl-deoxy-podophyllotoxin synthase-like [Aegilops tauschii subsp. strangulata]|uniref:Cytochrome P450 71D7 n=1 Tax=Aegilops tauschii subsp. strangulata TaxID=200361 RepID=A0A453TBE4_AEGTS|nr:desmethyl-deoxy-podophyllotoxin synthase-like [Aegilops tauschii subsp. strangulata]XP_044444893.1 desmethyl-deoxy-podophyllotoxin synthase-like [Triticum aestivum]